ncbi:MCE family protein [Mycolicibacterium monacense]|uniref:Virulence factor n=1 Tax=Mycolicibacterium monacense TaxID=85693 RepID=A0AAD1IZQ8_MYCMB|nr:MCE family protein [Mycolicibacterium monacense]MDA4102992.1 virulence factor Mce family protein [Mycolicibacterium monacense DSM 44395]ORB14335.1 MCE-family protein [Mycolicibacterium monacense DSM 44395]QHP87266.1 MCE family protein [Mycolicibacterium monacense DSM 44395]BBZ59622.1 virulence factor [Mycolicibacterium monacense]
MKGSAVRPLTGLALLVAIGLIIALAIGLFAGTFTRTVPVTVVSDRAGLVMNPDAEVKMRGVEVGRVETIERRPDGKAVLHLAMNPSQLHLIPSNVNVDIASTTVFGAKFVRFFPPEDPSPEKLRKGQVIEGQHVTVEVNTVFQQLVEVLDKIDPAKLNETLGAISSAFNGRGEKFGQTLVDLNAVLAKIEPSLPNLAQDIEASVPTLTAYGDAAPDLISAMQNTTQFSNTIVDQQQNLDEFLVSAIGLADIGNEVIGGNREALGDVLENLVPTAELLNTYKKSLWCGIGGLIPFAKSGPQYSGIMVSAGLTLGVERYRYPGDLPKVAAKSGGRDYCKELGLPELPPEFVPPMVVGDVGSNPAQYGNAGILLNSEGLKNWLFGPLDGPPRNTAQIGMPG